MKTILAKDINKDENVETTLMLMKKLSKENGKLIAFLGDKSGDIKANLSDEADELDIGSVLWVKGENGNIFEVSEFKEVDDFELEDYLPAVKRPIEDIMKELEYISKEEFKTRESIELNNYFFKNEEFVEKFKKGIGGLKQHHNYIGGLAEHSLNVMYMAKIMAHRYDCRNKEIAILAAKLHDIGKIEEYFFDGPFSTTLRGNMEGHIVIGINMIEEAFRTGGEIYSEDFKQRLKGCIVQHHGKPEFGSPKATNTEEAFIVHYADYIDATMNKVNQVREITLPETWSEYDRRIGTRLYV
ncbi:3'-5' exoribonuclease YhaM [Clostridium homopropionicum DSM 5847]|uniref:3'-5' exoribonuclease YhaM n=1 Tax=Clostridium homopropionicum DSM 5847 TaxID=1121318 RepID=A0A0L6ZCD6_9CLOT|nr:HD domain-containing protein [Clostridium homopropionicum]KOA20630.1 3'-5' exoribonuclease YhaM [Clostridium homopropionicum DSM 5847]SFF92756.1 3'-5' exoribonuclease [Clostridium homopropionicum]